MKIIFSDGTEEEFSKANANNCEERATFYTIEDEDENVIAEVNISFIKIIKWD
jgi:hypothetical protein